MLLGLRDRLRLSRLQLVTDLRGGTAPFVDLLGRAYAGGVDIVQVRDDTADEATWLEALREGARVALHHRALLCVGRRPDLARAMPADLLHLGASDGTMDSARQGQGRYTLVGRSVHTPAQLRAARREGADWLAVGPVWGPDAPGLDLARAAARELPVTDEAATPWFAVGGITLANLDEVLDAGAGRVAVSRAITDADDPQAAAAAFADRLRAHFRTLPGGEDHAYRVLGGPGRTATLNPVPPAPPADAAPGR